jgi:hypothetical protein
MPAIKGYDPSLQMFLEAPREPDLAHLGFLRWLAERGVREHPVSGPPSGQFAEQAAAHSLIAAPGSRAS